MSETKRDDEKVRKARLSITLQEKYQIIRDHESGTSIKDLCKKYSMGSSTVCTIIKSKEKYLSLIERQNYLQYTGTRCREVDSIMPLMEEILTAWIGEQRKENPVVNSAAICAKAISIFEMLKQQKGDDCKETFIASRGWLERYKKRARLPIKSRKKNQEGGEKETDDEFDFYNRMFEENWNSASMRGVEETLGQLAKADAMIQHFNYERSGKVVILKKMQA